MELNKNSKCYSCFGCNRLANENFEGIFRCLYYVGEEKFIKKNEKKFKKSIDKDK